MKCVVIGGSGFIGTRLIEELHPLWDVINLDKQDSDIFSSITYHMDVRDPISFAHYLQGADIVILLAAEHRDDILPTSLYFDVNVQGMRNVLTAMDTYNVKKIVFTSTVAVYGLDISTPLAETDKINPFNAYGHSKWEAEKLLQDWYASDNKRSALILRPAVVFGENNRGNVYNLLNQIYSGNFLMIGSGSNKKSMCYVENIVGFIKYMLNSQWEGLKLFNYVDKPDFDMNTLVGEVYKFKGKSTPRIHIPYPIGLLIGKIFDGISKITRRKLPVSSIRIKKFCANTLVDGSKLEQTGFVRPFTLVFGLQKMLSAEFKNKKR